MNVPTNTKAPRANKYIVLLASDASAADIGRVESAIAQPLVSSAELGSQLSASEVYARGQGIYFKNLNVAVVDDLDVVRAAQAVSGSSPVIHVERERIFYALATSAKTASAKPKPGPAAKVSRQPTRSPNKESQAGKLGSLADDRILAEVAALRQNLLAAQQHLDGLDALLAALPSPAVPGIDRSGTLTWGLRASAWGLAGTLTGVGARVAVLDTGIDPAHPSFAGRPLIGKSFVTDAWDADRNGHGTHCAGTVVGGRTQDDAAIAFGIAPGAELLIGRVLSDAGSGSTSGIIDAIDWALEKRSHVVSMSLGSSVRIGESPSLVFERVGQRALAQGCVLVAAAGNDSRRRQSPPKPVGSPANAQSVMAVGAIDERRRMADFSNGGINAGDGGAIDVVAPGVSVLSAATTLAGSGELYTKKSGTSMSTPHVAGIAALLIEQDPDRTGTALWQALINHAIAMPELPFRDVGAGLAQCPRS